MTADSREPQPDRPYMPDYGITPSEPGLLPWSWARERLAASHNYWLSTTRPDGRPHANAVWGVWLDDAFYFSMAPTARKARNIAVNPNCVVTTERADEAVIVEGIAEAATDDGDLQTFKAAYDAKYAWDIETAGIVVVRPRVAFGFIEAADKFTSSATRWKF